MKSIQLNNVMYKVPTCWDDVTLGQQIDISKIAQENTGMTSQLVLIAGYAGIPVDVIKKTNIKKLPTLVKHLDFINEEMDKEPIAEFEHKEHTYQLMESLMKGEFQDFISLESIVQRFKEEPYAGLPMMIAVLAKREGESLDDYDIEERSKEFYDLPIVIANKLSVFFSSLVTMSHLNTLISSEEMIKESQKELTRRFEELESTIKPQDGQGWLTRLQITLLRNYVRSIKKRWVSSLTITPSKSSKTNTIMTWRRFLKKKLKIKSK